MTPLHPSFILAFPQSRALSAWCKKILLRCAGQGLAACLTLIHLHPHTERSRNRRARVNPHGLACRALSRVIGETRRVLLCASVAWAAAPQLESHARLNLASSPSLQAPVMHSAAPAQAGRPPCRKPMHKNQEPAAWPTPARGKLTYSLPHVFHPIFFLSALLTTQTAVFAFFGLTLPPLPFLCTPPWIVCDPNSYSHPLVSHSPGLVFYKALFEIERAKQKRITFLPTFTDLLFAVSPDTTARSRREDPDQGSLPTKERDKGRGGYLHGRHVSLCLLYLMSISVSLLDSLLLLLY
ncbi:hypothetical protein AOQ84DRAFT_71726 [Glonium stellatum]|uniref:Uncharacterized protein n=1 Tax=Glonium stellatum TaxID=574774 RepID=A0A8E2JRE7_9PEZI|nr:hypothetical protein AOQ84DRAFT_71726 [Glonium stellatum]